MAKIKVAKATINAGRKAYQKLQSLIDPKKIPKRAGKVPSNPRKDQTLNEQKKKIITDFYNRYVFTFGGQIKNYVYEDIIENLEKFNEVFYE